MSGGGFFLGSEFLSYWPLENLFGQMLCRGGKFRLYPFALFFKRPQRCFPAIFYLPGVVYFFGVQLQGAIVGSYEFGGFFSLALSLETVFRFADRSRGGSSEVKYISGLFALKFLSW